LSRVDDKIYRTCSAIFIPNYAIAIHLVMLHSSVIFFAPFVKVSVNDMMKYDLSLKLR